MMALPHIHWGRYTVRLQHMCSLGGGKHLGVIVIEEADEHSQAVKDAEKHDNVWDLAKSSYSKLLRPLLVEAANNPERLHDDLTLKTIDSIFELEEREKT